MKTRLIIIACVISFTAFAEDTYVPPTTLTVDEAKESEAALINNKIIILDHWKDRLTLAKQNNLRLAKRGTPLQRPYYGDSVHRH
ncbi:MAG: hypothetical protein HOP02_13330 [Methylococcaceae bacterium]|nr:hypothetical protein [Methylococcaceae bacterium]